VAWGAVGPAAAGPVRQTEGQRMRTQGRWPALRVLTPERIVRDAHGQMWAVQTAPRWTGEQLRVRARLLRCAGVWGDLPAEAVEPWAPVGTGTRHAIR
jgi:hypothetical protein